MLCPRFLFTIPGLFNTLTICPCLQLKNIENNKLINFVPGHPWDEKGLQRQKSGGVLVCIPRMKSASRPADEPVTNRG